MQKALEQVLLSVNRVMKIADEQDSSVSDALRDAEVLARHETIRCAVTVILSGFLESFLEDVAEAFIDEVCGRQIPFEDLPLEVRATHLAEGARVLERTAKDEKKELRAGGGTAFDTSREIARRLASVSESSYELVWEAFADVRSNPNADSIRRFLDRFDVDEPFVKLAAAGGGSAGTLSTRIDSFNAVRNECAHTGHAGNVPTTSDIRGYCDLISNVAKGIVYVLEQHLNDPRFGPPSASVSGP